MSASGLDDILRQTLEDRRLTRGEKRALGEVLADEVPDAAAAARLAARAFAVARQAVEGADNHLVLDWLEDVVKVIRSAGDPGGQPARADAYFTPGHDAPAKIAELFDRARIRADVCVYTITDDRISGAILDAHRRGVAVRIVTDDEKSLDLGSDVDAFLAAGIPLRTDRSEAHMHHKFALFDGERLLTGSYNWTRGAAARNEENFIVTDDPRLVRPFARTFEDLWERLGP